MVLNTGHDRLLEASHSSSGEQVERDLVGGIGADLRDVMVLTTLGSRTTAGIYLMFGPNVEQVVSEADVGNTGSILYGNNGRMYMDTSGDIVTVTGTKQFGITSFTNVTRYGSGTGNFDIDFAVAEGDGTFGSFTTLSAANLTTAVSGFSDLLNNGVTIKYRFTRTASNLSDYLSQIKIDCTINPTFEIPFEITDLYSSYSYSLHAVRDLRGAEIVGDLEFTVAGTYTITNSEIGSVSNSSGGAVVVNPVGTTTIGTNNGPDITINAAAVTVTLTGLVAGSEVRAYVGTNPATAVEIDSTESSGTTFQFSQTEAGNDGFIVIRALGYDFIKIPITYEAASQSIPIQQRVDRYYSNP